MNTPARSQVNEEAEDLSDPIRLPPPTWSGIMEYLSDKSGRIEIMVDRDQEGPAGSSRRIGGREAVMESHAEAGRSWLAQETLFQL